jgi:hypothetical protein
MDLEQTRLEKHWCTSGASFSSRRRRRRRPDWLTGLMLCACTVVSLESLECTRLRFFRAQPTCPCVGPVSRRLWSPSHIHASPIWTAEPVLSHFDSAPLPVSRTRRLLSRDLYNTSALYHNAFLPLAAIEGRVVEPPTAIDSLRTPSSFSAKPQRVSKGQT